MDHKRITLFAGHYGSGKTNIAVNYALLLAREGRKTAIADLDIVNPYFRTKDSYAELSEAGIALISPQFANSNVDLPALPAEAYRRGRPGRVCFGAVYAVYPGGERLPDGVCGKSIPTVDQNAGGGVGGNAGD